ncbi:Retrovirus-related Pol polyprotein from transposon TNT 1-94 [Phytophthora rubi]|uniref:Retrovirus-related Pol polyprotein from transposon TNT 1-94 n=1 Tax=Phytophthora rubi TaxID=129364 RepID=A0A6A3P962_9STRA|nr:Retrovirus-related Pol polyprotein from transposon TNT 1-94 [Phytophthora rubi]
MIIDKVSGVVLDNVIYAPGFKKTLLSVKQLIDDGMKVEFTDKECLIYGKPIMRGSVERGVYTLDIPPGMAASALRPNSIEDWHQRLGHLNYRSVAELSKSEAVKGLKIVGSLQPSKTCEVCAQAKITRAPAPQRASRPVHAQDEIYHGDLAGPFRASYHRNKYYYALKWKGHTTVYFLKAKEEAATCFRHYMNIVNRRFSKLDGIKVYRSDNGGEFTAGDFQLVCDDEGITTEMSEPDVHHQNGVIERTHRTIADSARALMLQAIIPHYLWEYAVRSAVYSRNRVLSRSDPTKTPFEKFWGRKPDLKLIKTFGQRCVVLISPEKRSTAYKFRPKGRTGIFIGSDPQRKGFFVYVTGHGNQVIHSRSVVFLEPPKANPPTEYSDPNDDPFLVVSDDDTDIEENDDVAGDLEHPRRGLRVADETRLASNAVRDSVGPALTPEQVAALNGFETHTHLRRSERVANRSLGLVLSAAHVTLREVIREPLNLREAKASTEWLLWERAIREEIEALRANDTFDLVEPPIGAHIIGSTIVFRVKLGENGEVERLKARICAQGFTQEFLKDYFETYAPVAKLNSIRVFLALATQKGMRVRQGDVPTAYVKAGLSEVLYVRQPRGFEEASRSHVWRLKNALYGLKQAGREWNQELNNFLIEYGLRPTREDSCVYTHPTNELIVLIYVDDILIGYNDEQVLMHLMQALQSKYQIKDLGDVRWFLGIRINMDTTRGITTLDQTQFASEVLRRFGMDDCRPRKTPLDQGTILYKRAHDEEEDQEDPYRQAVGALLYLARVTRPDIAFAVNQVAAHASSPAKSHWTAVKNILRYIEGTKNMGLIYRRNESAVPVRVYTDADWVNNEEDRRSVSGVLVQVFGNSVSWQTKRQRLVSKSSTIAEYIAADDGVEEALWTRMLLQILMKTQALDAIPAMIDNKSTIQRLLNGKILKPKRQWIVEFLPFEMLYNLDFSDSSTAQQR